MNSIIISKQIFHQMEIFIIDTDRLVIKLKLKMFMIILARLVLRLRLEF